MANIYSDDFNRADSTTVGNGWSEWDYVAILSNKLRLGNASNNNCAVYRDVGSQSTFPLRMSGSFIFNGSSRAFYFQPYFTDSNCDGLGAGFTLGSTNNIVIHDNSFGSGFATYLARGSYTIDAGTTYYVWVDIEKPSSTYDCKLYLNTTNSKPSSPTLSATGITPSKSTSTYSFITVDSNNGQTWDVDFVSLDSGLDTAIKTINGLSKSSVKTINGLSTSSVKSFNGLA